MTNASCADCGRIVAFRTHDPTEIAECRNCGTWVKRTIEMPGVAVRLNKGSEGSAKPTSSRPAQLPPRKTIATSAPAPASTPEPAQGGGSSACGRRRSSPSGEEMVSASAVYAAIRELQTAVTMLQNGQRVLLERTLPVPDMPSPPQQQDAALVTGQVAKTVATAPLPNAASATATSHFYTTRFSSLKIPVIPASLEELGTSKQFSDEELGIAPIPESERTSLTQLVEEPLPEPRKVIAPQEPATHELPASETEPATAQRETPPVADTPFVVPASEFGVPEPEEEPEEAEEAPPSQTSPFAYPLKPASTREVENPFSTDIAEAPSADENETPQRSDKLAEGVASPFFVTSEDKDVPAPAPPATSNLSKQIAAAKSIQGAKPEDSILEQKSREELWSEPQTSKTGVITAVILALLAGLAAFLFLKTDLFSGKASAGNEQAEAVSATPPLLEIPPYGLALHEDDPLVAKAHAIALLFLESQNAEDIAPLINPVDPALLENFYEPLSAASVVRFYQGRQLPGERTEVDFLIKDYGRPERLLPLVKNGEDPFLVDWQTFAECEELTLLSLAQGTLILAGEVVDEGAIRSFVQEEGQNGPVIDNENWQAFRLLNLTEEVEAYAVVRKDKPEFQELSSALANTQLKHKGAPAIRAILRVKSIDKEDAATRRPARLEILDVISTTWRAGDSGETSAPEPQEEALPEGGEEAPIDEPGNELPPVSADAEPSAPEEN